jgi:virulence-associated protein VagC
MVRVCDARDCYVMLEIVSKEHKLVLYPANEGTLVIFAENMNRKVSHKHIS